MNPCTTPYRSIIRPSWIGSIESLGDYYQIVEALLSGRLEHIPRFPRENELSLLVRSGNIFVYAEPPTGPGHWNDRRSWMLVGYEGTFFVEREHSRSDALWKKSGAIRFQGVDHHFVAYFAPADTTLRRPSQASNFPRIPLRPGLARQLDRATE